MGVSQNIPEQQTGLPDLAVAGKEVQPRAITPIVRPLVAELVGTFSFFFIGAGAIITNTMALLACRALRWRMDWLWLS